MSAHHRPRQALARGAILLTVAWGTAAAPQRLVPLDGSPSADATLGTEAPAVDAATPSIHLDLNLPAYRLDVFLRHERVRSYRVAIGMPSHRTPRGTFEITQVQWNPPKAGSACNQPVTARGPNDVMGRVRLSFGRGYFLHGTPDDTSLGKPSSHGCVRPSNRDVMDLAILLQRNLVGIYASDSILRVVLPGRQSMTVSLSETVPIDVRYDPAEVVGDTLFIYPDPYGIGTSPAVATVRALTRADLDTTAVDFVRVRRLGRFPARNSVAVSVRRPPWP